MNYEQELRLRDSYRRTFGNARDSGTTMEMSYEEYRDFWLAPYLDGTPRIARKGSGRTDLIMARHDANKPFAIGNVFCTTRQDGCRYAAKGNPKLKGAWSKERKAAFRLVAAGHRGPKAVVTPLGEFESVAKAAAALNISKSYLSRLITKGKAEERGIYLKGDEKAPESAETRDTRDAQIASLEARLSALEARHNRLIENFQKGILG